MFYRRNWCLVRKSARILLTTQLSTFCDPPRKSGIWPILREADQQKCWNFGIWSICQPSKIRHDSGQLEEYFWIAGDRCFHSTSLQKGQKIPEKGTQLCWITDRPSRFCLRWMSRRLYVECGKYQEMPTVPTEQYSTNSTNVVSTNRCLSAVCSVSGTLSLPALSTSARHLSTRPTSFFASKC